MKPKLFVHRIHEHGDEWVFTIGTKLAVGPPRVRPKDVMAEIYALALKRRRLAEQIETHWPY